MKIEIKGLDKLNKMANNIKEIEKNGSTVSRNELFNNKFLHKYTNFSNIDELIEKSGYTFEEFGEVKEIDEYISKNSKFSSWNELRNKAISIYLSDAIFK